jgi:hypothetical protein
VRLAQPQPPCTIWAAGIYSFVYYSICALGSRGKHFAYAYGVSLIQLAVGIKIKLMGGDIDGYTCIYPENTILMRIWAMIHDI